METTFNNAETTAWQGHRDDLVRFVRKRVRDHAGAEDIVQDVLVKAYAN